LKKRENISGRFGDMLSYMYLITATLREFDNNPKSQDKILVDYVCNYAFEQIQIAKEDILYNLPMLKIFVPLARINPISIKSPDKLNEKIVNSLKDETYLKDLTSSVFVSSDTKDRLNILEKAIELNNETKPSFIKIKLAVKNGDLKKDSLENIFKEAFEKTIITKEELSKLKRAHKVKQKIIEVDSYKARTYKTMR